MPYPALCIPPAAAGKSSGSLKVVAKRRHDIVALSPAQLCSLVPSLQRLLQSNVTNLRPIESKLTHLPVIRRLDQVVLLRPHWMQSLVMVCYQHFSSGNRIG